MSAKKEILLIDLDDTANMFSETLHEILLKNHPELEEYPLEQRPIYEIENYYPPHVKKTIIDTVGAPGFILNLDPKHGFVEAVNILKDKYTIFFCSSPTTINPELSSYEKHLWLKRYFGTSDNLILTRDKTMVAGDFLIDDKPKIEGFCNPSWKRFMYHQTYNEDVICDGRFMNWVEILNYFNK